MKNTRVKKIGIVLSAAMLLGVSAFAGVPYRYSVDDARMDATKAVQEKKTENSSSAAQPKAETERRPVYHFSGHSEP